MLKFITGNKNKVLEVKALLAPIKVEQSNINLKEIQEIDARKILKHKLAEAFKHHRGKFIVEDSALYLDCLNGKLPGPLIKWFNDTLEPGGVYRLAKKMGNTGAKAQTIFALAKNSRDILFFEGMVRGKITTPKGAYRFGYDEIFQPKDFRWTLSQLKAAGDFTRSPRGIAVAKLKRYLLRNHRYTK
jgi:inosine triphosphate pyrophosphatase